MESARRAFRYVFYRFIVGSLRLILTTAARVEFQSFAPLPKGAFIMASNHISHFDPPFLSGWIRPKIDWIAMAELFGTSWSRLGFTWLDVIPVQRGGDDRQALREALRRLAAGHVIGVFPEGGIRDGDKSMLSGAPVRDGAVMLSTHSACPIVPVVILGSERLYNKTYWLPWRRARVFIATGSAIFPDTTIPRSEARERLRQEFTAAIIALKDQLVVTCHLGPDDLPHSPQQRMAEV